MDYFEALLQKPSLFNEENKLDINYIPDLLPHREKELSLLSQLFLTLITNPNLISRKIVITGKTGVGKTVTVKKFGELLKKAASVREIPIKYIHINCRKERTQYKVLIKIVRDIKKNFPKRGYSPQDLLETILEFLENQNYHLLIVLDELSYLIDKGGDLIYTLTRINDDSINAPQRISIIGIVRDISCLNNLDNSTLSTLQRNIVKFTDYTPEQIFDILKYRIATGLKNNVISDDLIKMIAKIVSLNGDIRYGLTLIWRACKIAESKNLNYITAECIRLGNQDLVPVLTQDTLAYLTSQKLIFLLSIIRSLNKSKETSVSISNVLKLYHILCENAGLPHRSYSQLWNYLQEYKKESIVSVKIMSERIKGRKALLEIPNIPLNKFEATILKLLAQKGIKL
jgi:cell division control protein 6